jgi:hypothetical protein
MKLKTFEIILKDANKLSYKPGEFVRGSIILETTQPIKYRGIRLKFKGRAVVTTFVGDYDTEKQTYFSGHYLLEGKVC